MKEVIDGLKQRVYPRMDALLRDFYAVMLFAVGNEVTEDAIDHFKLDEICEKLKQKQVELDDLLVRQINDMIKDVEYLSMMETLEKEPEKRHLHPHIVPISGLVESSIVRLQSECRTVLEMWTPKDALKLENQESEKEKKKNKKAANDDFIIASLKKLGITPGTVDDHNRTPLHAYCKPGGELEVCFCLNYYNCLIYSLFSF